MKIASLHAVLLVALAILVGASWSSPNGISAEAAPQLMGHLVRGFVGSDKRLDSKKTRGAEQQRAEARAREEEAERYRKKLELTGRIMAEKRKVKQETQEWQHLKKQQAEGADARHQRQLVELKQLRATNDPDSRRRRDQIKQERLAEMQFYGYGMTPTS